MRILHLTAGTGRWHCGTCIRDDALVKALRVLGHEADLVPLYLPIVADGLSCSAAEPVLVSGVAAYLQQEVPLFRHLPRWVDGLLGSRPLLDLAGRFAGSTRPESLGAMTVSMLRGLDGNQRSALEGLVEALQRRPKPNAIVLSNSLLVGLAAPLKAALGVPVVVTIQGEPHFIDALDEGRDEAWDLVTTGLDAVDGRVAVSTFAADWVARRTGLARSRFDVVPNGIDVEDYLPPAPADPPVLGYLGRLYAPKGLDRIVEIWLRLRAKGSPLRLRLGGTLNPGDQPELDAALARVREAGLADQVEVRENLSREGKRAFLHDLTVFCVPAAKDETFGMYHLEAMAAGVPVVAPARGAVPEVIGDAAGLLVPPDDLDGFVAAIERLLADPDLRARLASAGPEHVRAGWTSSHMARGVLEILQRLT